MKNIYLHPANIIRMVMCMVIFPIALQATHIIGGDISYRFLGIGKYEITLELYQSCQFGSEAFDDPAYIGIYDGAGELIQSLPIAAMQADTLGLTQGDECYGAPATVCVQHMTYRSKVELDNDPADGFYRIAYQRCCRGARLENIEKPGDTGAVYEILLTKDAIDRCNSSPVFRAWPPMAVCANKAINFDHSASDANDHKYDSLVYSLCTPLAGSSRKTNPRPIPPNNPPPFDSIKWLSPDFSANDPFGVSGKQLGEVLNINSLTGILTGVPVEKGQYVVGVCVTEYDRETKKLLSISRRDFQVVVDDCTQDLTLSLGEGECSPDLKSYSVQVTTNGVLITDQGEIEEMGEGVYLLKNIPIGVSALVRARNADNSCNLEANTIPIGCDCDRVNVTSAISGGDRSYCVGTAIPMLSASVPVGYTVDWYDAPTGGNLLASGKVFQAFQGGTYYAEARDSFNSCTSTERIPITLNANPNPSFVGSTDNIVCSPDLNSYQVTFTTDADLVQNTAGILINNDGGSYTVIDIPAGIDLIVMLANSRTGCTRQERVRTPSCDCDIINIAPPISGGDQEVCDVDGIPALSVMIPDGVTIDWYAVDTGGEPIATSTTVFVPTGPGTYYAEARHAVNSCVSATRTAITLSVKETPTFELIEDSKECSDDLLTYSVKFNSNAETIEISAGQITKSADDSYTVSGIPNEQDLVISLSTPNQDCPLNETILAPVCKCPDEGVAPPISGGDQLICEEEAIVPLTVTAIDGIEVDWYDAPIQGNLLATNTTTYLPGGPGVYYAEARDISTSCTSANRVSIRLVRNELPSYDLNGDGVACAEDLQSYSVSFTSNANAVEVSSGNVSQFGTSFTVSGVDLADNLNITLRNTVTECQRFINITPPICTEECEDFIVPAPLVLRSGSYCEGQDVPTIEVQVASSTTVDWYDSPFGGNLLAEGTTTYTPAGAGIYYAEGRDIATNCVGKERTPVVLSLLPLPTFEFIGEGATCAEDKQSYFVRFSSDAEQVVVSSGNLTQVNEGEYEVTIIPLSTNLVVDLTNPSTGCNRQEIIQAPECDCPGDGNVIVLSGGDASICEGDPLPELTALAENGYSVDWYDAPVGGRLLRSNSNSFTPVDAGIYYAEPVDSDSNCPAGSRAAVRLVVNTIPSYVPSSGGPECSSNLEGYQITFTSNANVVQVNAGIVTNIEGSTYSVTGIDHGVDVTITLINNSTGCERSVEVAAPDCPTCEEIEIRPPVIGESVQICEGDDIPTLTARVENGETVDWYSNPVDGEPILKDALSFTPNQPGVYYAETRRIVNNCTSSLRTRVELIIEQLPVFALTADGATCNDNRIAYQVTFNTDAVSINLNAGDLVSNGGNNYTVQNVPTTTNLEITLLNAASCENKTTILAPVCPCTDEMVDPPLSGGDQVYCEGEEIPTLSVTTTTNVIVNWYDAPVGGSQLANNTVSFQPTQAGTYYAEAVSAMSQCASSRVGVSLNIIELPSYTPSNTDPVCSPDLQSYSVFFVTDASAINASAGQVEVQNGQVTISGIPIERKLSITLEGAGNDCERKVEIEAPICESPCEGTNIPNPISGGDKAICEGESMPVLTATTSDGVAVDWYDARIGGNLLLSNSNRFDPIMSGTYYAEARDLTTGCTSDRVSVALRIIPLPNFNLAGNNPVCSPNGKSFSFSFTTNADGVLVSAGELIRTGNGAYTVSNVTGINSVKVTLESNTLACKEEIEVNANCPCIGFDITAPEAVADTITTCGNEVAPGLEVSQIDGLVIDWYDAPENGNLLSSDSTIFTPSEPGTYYAEVRSAVECLDRIPVTWAIREVPSYTQLGDPKCQPNQDFYDFAFLTDAVTINVNAGELVKIGEGDYEVQNIPMGIQLRIDLTYEDGKCTRSEFVSAPICEAICEEPYVFIPSAFTPNGDGVNDMFRVRGEAIEAMKLMVYNRWGEEIFYTEDQADSWNGTFKGKVLPPGVYGFYLTVECIGGTSYNKKGDVTLIR